MTLRYLCLDCSLPILDGSKHVCAGDLGWQHTALRLIWKVLKAQGVAVFN